MSDAGEIASLVHSYARLLDGGDVDAVAALFEHSTWRSMPDGSRLRGSEEVRPVDKALIAQQGDPPHETPHHHLTHRRGSGWHHGLVPLLLDGATNRSR